MRFQSSLNKWKKELADQAIENAVKEAEEGVDPATVSEHARARVDAAILSGERVKIGD